MFAASKDGRVANAQIRIQASNFNEAEREAFNLVMPILSRWSYEYDVALDLKFYEVVEEQTLVQKLVIGLVGKAKPLGVNISGLSKPEFRVIFAAYREAINATNVFYQLLCFYKVIEGVKSFGRNGERLYWHLVQSTKNLLMSAYQLQKLISLL